jgi:hypothetical protein
MLKGIKIHFKPCNRSLLLTGLSGVITALFIVLFGSVTIAQAIEWPREIDSPDAKIMVYQPQLETFKNDKMTGRAAVSVTKKSEKEPVFGAVWMTARVSTDRNMRTVRLLDLDVTKVKFPESEKIDPENIKRFEALLEAELPKGIHDISLDRVLAMLELVEKEKAVAKDLKHAPPKIIFISHPAMLVTIDGEPELREVKNSALMRVINTAFFIAFDPSKKMYYLKGGNEWLSSPDVMGPWKAGAKPPASVVTLAAQDLPEEQRKEETSAQTSRMPQIIVTTVPAELIVSEGDPKYKTISGTGLLYMSNTDNDIFMEIDSQQYFVLLSGRWYASKSLTGTWSYVPSDQLPADFRKIPEGSKKGRVLAQVAGTEQAQDAVLDTYIPQTASVKRSDTPVTVVYDGTPKFEKIKETDMSYAVNTSYSVILVGTTYYLCHNAVWYVASNPSGPWTVAVSVPQVIYTMPPSSPVYNVKYVYIYDYTPEVVYIGYYPGYVGSYVYGGTVVYGTGWYYRPWYGYHYYPRPVTWGVAVRYNPYTGGWGVRVGYGGPVGWVGYGRAGWVGVGRVGWYGGGWYGGGRYYGDVDISRSVTTPRGTWTSDISIDRKWGETDIDRNISFEPNENLYDRKEKAREERAQRSGERARTPDDRKRDSAGRDRSTTQTGREKAGSRSFTDKDLSRYKNNVVTDKKGNVYRKTESGWQQRDRGSWSKPDTGSRKSSFQQNRSSLERNHNARSRGTQRSSSFNQYRGSGSSRSGGYTRGSRGGSRGGGRRR